MIRCLFRYDTLEEIDSADGVVTALYRRNQLYSSRESTVLIVIRENGCYFVVLPPVAQHHSSCVDACTDHARCLISLQLASTRRLSKSQTA